MKCGPDRIHLLFTRTHTLFLIRLAKIKLIVIYVHFTIQSNQWVIWHTCIRFNSNIKCMNVQFKWVECQRQHQHQFKFNNCHRNGIEKSNNNAQVSITLYPSFLAAKVNDCLFRNSISEIRKNCCENLSEKKLNKQIQCIARNSWHSKYNEPYYKDKAKNEKRKVVSMEPICEWTKWIFLAGKIMWLEVATHFIAHNNYMHYDFAYLPWRIKIIKEKFAGV